MYLEIRQAIYGLPQAGILANKLLRERLEPFGYYEVAHTPGLWRHTWRPVSFTLVVDDFGVKYVDKKHAWHLVEALKKCTYQLEDDWEGKLYCGISLEWNYQERYLDISMPQYAAKVLQRFDHKKPNRPQHSPYLPEPRKFGQDAQDPLPEDTSERVDEKRILRIQQVVGAVLYYARAVDLTHLAGLSSIASAQNEATVNTELRVEVLLDYLSTHPDATLRYWASDMILNIHSDASYLSEAKAKSQVAGYYFMGLVPKNG